MSDLKKSGLVQYILIDLRSGLWFVPALVIFGTIALAIGLIELDQHIGEELRRAWPRLFSIEAEGARSMLSVIAGSMATVAGVAFSITVVALALASTQYTSRVLRNFMRDRANQLVLGMLIGVYIYCLLVLRSIGGANGNYVPALAVHAAFVLALISSGVFIFFIHHISTSIQASDMIAAITRETLDVIDVIFPEHDVDTGSRAVKIGMPESTVWQPVPATSMGYIQSVDLDALSEFARTHGTVVRMERGMGEFAAPDRPLVSLALSCVPDRETVKALNKIYAIDTYRTIEQDPAFGIRQLVDISLKALSPGINDTTTAATCIEHLSVLLTRCAGRGMAAPPMFEGDTLRVIVHRRDFSRLLSLAFNQILENAEGNTDILLNMLSAIKQIAGATHCVKRIATLSTHVDAIKELAERSIKSPNAKREIDGELQRICAFLEQQKSTCEF